MDRGLPLAKGPGRAAGEEPSVGGRAARRRARLRRGVGGNSARPGEKQKEQTPFSKGEYTDMNLFSQENERISLFKQKRMNKDICEKGN